VLFLSGRLSQSLFFSGLLLGVHRRVCTPRFRGPCVRESHIVRLLMFWTRFSIVWLRGIGCSRGALRDAGNDGLIRQLVLQEVVRKRVNFRYFRHTPFISHVRKIPALLRGMLGQCPQHDVLDLMLPVSASLCPTPLHVVPHGSKSVSTSPRSVSSAQW
jgi:hypothetical protein